MNILKTSILPIATVLAFAGSAYGMPAPRYNGAIADDIGLANANFTTQTVDQRLDNLRTGSESFGQLAPVGAKASVDMSKDGKSVQVGPEAAASRWSSFLSLGYTFAKIGGTDGGFLSQPSSKLSAESVLLGADTKLTDNLTAGLFLTYAHTDADLDTDGSNANTDTYGVGTYAGYNQGPFYVNGLFSYARNIYETDRHYYTSSPVVHGRTAGNQYLVNLDGGYDLTLTDGLTVGPFAGLQYVHLGVDGYTESGSGAQQINEQSLDSLRSRIGVRAQYRRDLSQSWVGAADVRAGWQHEFADNARSVSFDSSYSMPVPVPMRDMLVAGVGVNATYCQKLTVFANYDLTTAERYVEQIVKGGVKWAF